MIIVWSPRAIEHLAHLRLYIARDNPKVADQIASHAARRSRASRGTAESGPSWSSRSTRELVVPGTRFVIYRLRGDRLEVIADFHGRQKWPKSLCSCSGCRAAARQTLWNPKKVA